MISGKEQGLLPASCGKEGQKAQGQHVVRTDTDKNLIRVHFVLRSQGIHERCRVHIRIQAQGAAVSGKLTDCLFYAGCRRIGAFIGVELDDVFLLGLLARHIGFHLADLIFPGHNFFLFFPYIFQCLDVCVCLCI